MTQVEIEERLAYPVPGVYLVRGGEELREELAYAGLLLARRFLAHAINSDYLLVFDKNTLMLHCKPEEETWASKIKPTASLANSVDVQEVVAVRAEQPPQADTKKKNRPGRHVRQMLKALITASTGSPLPSVEQVKDADGPSADIPEGSNLTIRGNGPRRTNYLLRQFRVDDKMRSDRDNVEAHLTIYYPPSGISKDEYRDKKADKLALDHADRCHSWIKKVIASLEVCGVLSEGSCRVLLSDPDLSRLSRPNLQSLQCRFRDDVPLQTRNAVYAILRSCVWFRSLQSDDNTQQGPRYLVRCWWRQPPTSE